MQEIGRAVERVDDPAMGFVVAVVATALLAEKTVAGPRLGQFSLKNFLGAAVGGGDEIGRSFQRDLQVLDFAEIAL